MRRLQLSPPRSKLSWVAWLIGACIAVSGVCLFALSFTIDPWSHQVSFTSDFHVTMYGKGVQSNITFFNDLDYGPYRGSTISLAGPDDDPFLAEHYGFGRSFGIYWRYFLWKDGGKLWTLMISVWHPIISGISMITLACLRFKENELDQVKDEPDE